MTPTGPTYGALRDLLLELGFEDHSTAGKNQRFDYPVPDTIVLLPPYRDDEIVRPHHLFDVRILLEYRGLMSPAEFDEALGGRSLAG